MQKKHFIYRSASNSSISAPQIKFKPGFAVSVKTALYNQVGQKY